MNKRDNALDLMKLILVLQMISAHIVQFFPAGARMDFFSLYANLTTFSGFVFVLGYVSYRAYIGKNEKVTTRLLKGFFKSILAFYISSIAITYFVYNDLNLNSFLEIIIFKRVPGYSEFLLSYACIYLFILALTHFKFFKEGFNSIWLIILVTISLGLTFIDYQRISNNLLGSIIGTYNYPCFPIIQYMSYFLTGMYLSKFRKIFSPAIIVCSMLGTGVFLRYLKAVGSLPMRFPPSIYWIVGGWFMVYLYYLVTKVLCDKMNIRMPVFLLKIGQNTLIFLVVSNVVIFAFWHHCIEWYTNKHLGYIATIGFYLLLMACCMVVAYSVCMVKDIKKEKGKKYDIKRRSK